MGYFPLQIQALADKSYIQINNCKMVISLPKIHRSTDTLPTLISYFAAVNKVKKKKQMNFEKSCLFNYYSIKTYNMHCYWWYPLWKNKQSEICLLHLSYTQDSTEDTCTAQIKVDQYNAGQQMKCI